MIDILPAAPHGTTDQMSPTRAAVPGPGWSRSLVARMKNDETGVWAHLLTGLYDSGVDKEQGAVNERRHDA